MMTVNNVSINNSIQTNSTKIAASAKESKNLQHQLTSEQQRLNRLSSDGTMSTQEKQKEKREIQQEIAELNRKLNQERLKEKQEAKEAAKEQKKKQIIKEEMFEKANVPDKNDINDKTTDASIPNKSDPQISPNTERPLKALEKAFVTSSVIEQNKVTEEAYQQIENRKNVLRAEIQSDSLYGTDTTAKKEQISKLQKKEQILVDIINPQPKPITSQPLTSSKIIIRE